MRERSHMGGTSGDLVVMGENYCCLEAFTTDRHVLLASKTEEALNKVLRVGGRGEYPGTVDGKR